LYKPFKWQLANAGAFRYGKRGRGDGEREVRSHRGEGQVLAERMIFGLD